MLSRSDERILDKLAVTITTALFAISREIRAYRIQSFGPANPDELAVFERAVEDTETTIPMLPIMIPPNMTYEPGPNAAVEGEDV